ALKPDGSFMKFTTTTQALLQSDAIDRVARNVAVPDHSAAIGRAQRTGPANPDDWLTGRVRWPQQAVLSPDSAQLYLLLAAKAPRFQDEVAVLDAQGLDRLRTIPLARRYSSLVMSGTGSQFYAVDNEGNSVAVVDVASGRVIRAISDVGPSPVFAIVAP
ncbi:MAG: YncE family protein, partial [Vicinamibacterales bacterium]